MMNRRKFIQTSAGLGLAVMGRPISGSAAAAPGYQVGCYTRPWDLHEYRVALDGIAEAGFKYAGLMTAKGKSWVLVNVDSTPEEVAAIAAAVKERGLKTISIYGGDFHAEKSVAEGIAGLKRLIDHCGVCGCPNLLLGGTSNEKVFAAYYKAVAECCAYAQEKGVNLSIKPHGGQNATGPQCRKIIESIGHQRFRLWYDPGNIFYYSDVKLDPAEDAATVNGLVAGMSIKDFVPPKEVMVTPGQGRVNFRAVMKQLRGGGFTSGPLVVECLTRGDGKDPKTITAEAKKARQFVEELVA